MFPVWPCTFLWHSGWWGNLSPWTLSPLCPLPLGHFSTFFPTASILLFSFPWHSWSASHFCLPLDGREWSRRWGTRKPEQRKEALPLSGHSLESPQGHQSFHAIRRDSVFSFLDYSLEELLNLSLLWARGSLSLCLRRAGVLGRKHNLSGTNASLRGAENL